MSEIPRSYIDNFSDGLESLSVAYKSKLADALSRIDYGSQNAESSVAALMRALCGSSASAAAYLAKLFYMGLREGEIGDDGYEGVEDSAHVPAATETATRGIFASYDATAEDGFAIMSSQLQRRLGYETKRAAGNTLFANGRIDPRRPRFARIPRGSRSYPRGCPFCQMLASRGFVYLSEYSAGGTDPNHYHDDCRCAIVPSWSKDPIVEGYDKHDYDDGYIAYLGQDHSKHEAKLKETRKNRYDRQGRLKAGYSGLRIDKQEPLTSEDRKAQHRKNVAAQHAGWKAAYARKHQQQ